jgi:TonB family protein
MSSFLWGEGPQSNKRNRRLFTKSILFAILAEGIVLIALGWHHDWLAHPPATTTPTESQFIETEMIQLPQEAHLYEEKHSATSSAPAKAEVTLSKKPGQGKPSQDKTTPLEEENQTSPSPPPIASTHGPIAVYAPSPSIPSYLQDQDLKTYVVIDFFVTANGQASPRLVGSSGNEELDAIAISAAKRWQFRPAEENGRPVDAKVRLRILFEVK